MFYRLKSPDKASIEHMTKVLPFNHTLDTLMYQVQLHAPDTILDPIFFRNFLLNSEEYKEGFKTFNSAVANAASLSVDQRGFTLLISGITVLAFKYNLEFR